MNGGSFESVRLSKGSWPGRTVKRQYKLSQVMLALSMERQISTHISAHEDINTIRVTDTVSTYNDI